ncbi:MAG TPA: phosphoserine transaminase [Rhodospirillaceae bacterium]|nr:phosphoserine transaminase [Rhodospirillaceae bacterium]
MPVPQKPGVRPANPCFSTGPCAKRPGWSFDVLKDAFLGRSHRHGTAKAKLNEVITRSRAILGIPDDFYVGILPGSDTGAFEAAMWNLLGARGVDLLAWENFGNEWLKDGDIEMKLPGRRVFKADFGEIPDLSQVDFNNDVVFTWNGTSSGVMVPGGDWIADDRAGLTLCDATSCIFGVDLPWHKLDVTTWSWQKVMGGEAAHGMIALSPRAVERLNTFEPDRAIPKVFRMKKNGKINPEPFEGSTLNTPSMLCVEDALDGLKWAEDIGGLPTLMGRVQSNYEVVCNWVERTPWVDFLATDPAIRSCTSVTLKVVDSAFDELSEDELRATLRRIPKMCEAEEAGYDFSEHKSAPPGFRIWCGATVETKDLEALFPWIEWAFHQIRAELAGEAA